MAFLSAADLTQRVIIRLRQTPGTGTQLYAEPAILQLLEETYEMVRVQRWWDHMMQWMTRYLDGTTGLVTVPFSGARERFRDVQQVCWNNIGIPLPQLGAGVNPYRLVGTTPRFIEPLHVSDDSGGTLLFRVWPLTSVASAAVPLRIHLRTDPTGLFTDVTKIVPFDATCLVNGTAAKYAADDGMNSAATAMLQHAFEDRLHQLQKQHDSATLSLDPRLSSTLGLSVWAEER